MVSRAESAAVSSAATVPSSSTMPVNMAVSSLPGGRAVIRTSGPRTVTSVGMEAHGIGDGGDAEVGGDRRRRRRAGRGDVGDHLVDEAGGEEGGGEGRAALEQHAVDAACLEGGEHLGGVVGGEHEGLGGAVEQPRRGGQGAVADDDAQRLGRRHPCRRRRAR